jgi:hypothetical protein
VNVVALPPFVSKRNWTHFNIFCKAFIFSCTKVCNRLVSFYRQIIAAWIIIITFGGLRMNHPVELNNFALIFMVNNIDVGDTKGSNLNLRWLVSNFGKWRGGGGACRVTTGACDSKIAIRLSCVNSEFSSFRRNGIASAWRHIWHIVAQVRCTLTSCFRRVRI